MSKDIRSFFTVQSATKNVKKTSLKNEKLGRKRKSVTVIDSDSDEECFSTSTKRNKISNGVVKTPTDLKKSIKKHDNPKSEKRKRALVVIDSDSDEDLSCTSTKKNKLSDVVESKSSTLRKESQDKVSKYFRGESVSASNIFSAKPIKRDNSRNILKVSVKKEAPEFNIDKDFESELLRLDEVVQQEFQFQNLCDTKLNSLEDKLTDKCGDIVKNHSPKSVQDSESSKRESTLEKNAKLAKSPEKASKTNTLSSYNKIDGNLKVPRYQREVKSSKESPVKNLIFEGSREKRTPTKFPTSPLKEVVARRTRTTPSKISETSCLKDLSNSKAKTPSKISTTSLSNSETQRTRKTPSKTSATSYPKDLPNKKPKTPSKISVTSPSNSEIPDSPEISERLNKPKKTPLFTNKAEKSTEAKVSLKENKSYNDPKTSFVSPSDLWVDKYKPTTTKQIIGQQGDKSCVNKLTSWLKNWYRNQCGNKKLTKPSPWAKNDDGGYFKAALLSGPPGVGKTTTAHLVTKELGFDVVEFNASDTRSKKLLHQEVSELLSTNSLSPFVTGKDEHVSKKHVLLMDEVDGMAGNEDRGGVQELILLIKQSRVPIICMCNDRNHPKIRSLANYCFDLRFSKPRVEQIKGAMMSMCFKEKLKLNPNTITDIISSANQDIRLIINHLSMLAVENSKLANSTKHIKMGPWDITRKIFSEEEHKSMSIYDKCDLFFHDYSVTPLFVQENYLNAVPHKPEAKNKIKKMELFAAAAKSLSLGDLTEKSIRSHNAWGLLPVQAVFSSLVPGDTLEGHIGAQINFPGWFGKNSRTTKMSRLLQELTVHSRLKISGNKEAMNLDYVVPLESSIVSPLLREGAGGIPQALEVLSEYCLVREDLESLGELTSWPNSQNRFSQVESKVKAAFTRAYNKTSTPTPYAAVPIKKGSRAEVDFIDSIPDEEEEVVSQTPEGDEEDDDSDVDAMIVVKKKQPAKKVEKEAAPSTSKGSKTSKRGRKK